MLPLAPETPPSPTGGVPSFCVLCSRIAHLDWHCKGNLALLMLARPCRARTFSVSNGLCRSAAVPSFASPKPPPPRCFAFFCLSSDNQHQKKPASRVSTNRNPFLIRSFLLLTVAEADYVFLFVYDLASCYHSHSFLFCLIYFYFYFLDLFCLS